MYKKITTLTFLFLFGTILSTAEILADGNFPGKQTSWNGCPRYDFKIADRDAIVVVPKKALKGNPWIWRPAFFDAFPSVDKALLEEGFHIAYYDLTHLYGSPRAMKLGKTFYDEMTQKYNLSPKVTLEGFSRGGMCAVNWASKYPESVACIYIDAPVCDVFSWPSKQSNELWKGLLAEWNLTDAEMEHFTGNPIDNLPPIAEANIPIFAVCGDSDKVVPYEQNMDILRKRFIELGGSVEVILKPGCDHHPHSLENPEPVVEFVLRNQPEYKNYQHYTLRGSFRNAFIKFEKERKGRVAFLGGSITEMTGWHNRVMNQLKARFPFTEFDFIEAGIGSTGSTPGAFRMEHDVLSKGKIDLLFEEAVVNDHTNEFTPEEQVRGMEGIVRHALNSNPEMDIMILYFIYDPFIDICKSGRTPDTILNHERVANHYKIPSINLVQEIFERMEVGEFDWEKFGGTHPSWFGHRFYAAAIEEVFDQMLYREPTRTEIIPHDIPADKLDDFSYTAGDFLDIKNVKPSEGWQYVETWNPGPNVATRGGFVNVPMLEVTQPGKEMTLEFEGTAIGIFCVCGPDAGIIEYSIDNSPIKTKNTFTHWSHFLYIPWVYVLESELSNGKHTLMMRMSESKDPRSKGTSLQIRNFVVNPQ